MPGIPLKLFAPEITLRLVEAHGKKATFLREVIRTLGLKDATVLNRRAENLLSDLSRGTRDPIPTADCSTWNTTQPPSAIGLTPSADLVTLRAVEKFADILPVAARLVRPSGRLGLLIGSAQIQVAISALPDFSFASPHPIPLSANRVVLTGLRQQ